MSAIRSLLRVMTLRDAEAIVLEPLKAPALRRRGQVEALAMAPLEAAMIQEFAAPLLAGRDLDAGPVTTSLQDDGTSYAVTIDRGAAGIRLVLRRSAAPTPPVAPAPPAATSGAWWAQPAAPAPPPAPATGPMTGPTGAPLGDPSRSSAPLVHGGAQPHAPAAHAHARAALAALLSPLVADARQRGASDVIISTGASPRARVDGALLTLDHAVDDEALAACVAGLSAPADHTAAADLALVVDGGRLRVSAFDHLGGYGVVARLIRDEVPALAALGLPSELASVVDHRDGLVLCCGPTGSGKSTTLAALVAVLDQRRAAHVITLEDPIEFALRPRRGLIHQREIGTHAPSFAAGLRAALREAPDVIVLGELRDPAAIAAALTAAETGHLVLASLHAPHAGGAIDRLLDAFGEADQRQVRGQLALALRAIVTQHLVPRRGGGRAAAVELCPVTPAVAALIRKGELQQLPTVIQSGREHGMVPLERALARLLERGEISAADARRFAQDRDLLASLASR